MHHFPTHRVDVWVNGFIDRWLENGVMMNHVTEIRDGRQAIFPAVTNLFVPDPCVTGAGKGIKSLGRDAFNLQRYGKILKECERKGKLTITMTKTIAITVTLTLTITKK